MSPMKRMSAAASAAFFALSLFALTMPAHAEDAKKPSSENCDQCDHCKYEKKGHKHDAKNHKDCGCKECKDPKKCDESGCEMCAEHKGKRKGHEDHPSKG